MPDGKGALNKLVSECLYRLNDACNQYIKTHDRIVGSVTVALHNTEYIHM